MKRNRKLRTGNGKRAAAQRKPMTEGIIPLRSNGQRNWSSLSDKELVEHAQRFVDGKKIESRRGLRKENNGLYGALNRRKLLGKLEFLIDRRRWSRYTDQEFVEYAQKFVEEKEIKNRKGLVKDDGGLYETLRKRGLLDRIQFQKCVRDWTSKSDDEFIEYAQRFVEEKEIKNRKGLEKDDGGLYEALRKRNLLDLVFSDLEHSEILQGLQQAAEAMWAFGEQR